MPFAQLPLSVRLRDASVFATFFGGRNQGAVEALCGWFDARGPVSVWLHGPESVGKSHLLQALCARSAERGARAAYLPLRDMIGTGVDLLRGYGELDLVCLDDAELIAGAADWERAAFRLHQELEERGGRLAGAGASAPAALPFALKDLQSRCAGGLVLRLQALGEHDQIAALRLRAQQRGVELPLEVAQFLLNRLPRDMGSLCAFLDELDLASLAAQRRLTTPFVREVLERRGA